MADTNDFGDIQGGFEYIAKVLDSMRVQNAMNSDNTDKVLISINRQLETLSNEENADLIKIFLAELKRSLEERHNFVSTKFGEIETSFKSLSEKTENQLQASEIKEIFEIIATNLNVFSQNFSSQKDLIAEIGLKLEELKQDDSQKKEVLKNISTLKTELEKFGNGFESIILTLNGKFQEISQLLVNLDSSESLTAIKKDIENVFLSSNAILSTLQVIDHKNRELEEVITQVVTKDDFNLEREQVAKLITQNIQISDFISALPKQVHVEALSEKVDTAVGIINALKNMLNTNDKQNQQILTAQLENLEAKILNISTEEEFIGFRKELSTFADEIIKHMGLIKTDLESTNIDLKDLRDALTSMDIKNTFENFSTLTKTSENNLKKSLSTLSEDLAVALDKNKNLTKTDIDASATLVSEKIELAKEELAENSKLNMGSILEHIQSVINNIFSVKNAMHIENMETVETIDTKLQGLKENLAESSNYIVQTSRGNLENILSDVEKVFQEITSVKASLGETSEQYSTSIEGGFSNISKKIGEIKNELSQTSQENFANILSLVEDFSQEITTIKASLEESSQGNSEEIKGFIESLSEKLFGLQSTLTQSSELNKSEIKFSIEELSRIMQSLKSSLEQSSSVGFSGLKSNIAELSEELKVAQESFNINSQSNLSKIILLFEDLSNEFNTHKDFLSESSQINFESISLYMQNLNQKIEEAKVDFNEDFKAGFAELQASVLTIPAAIREDQAAHENESRSLLEENSKNIEEIGDKIQNLVKGVISKDAPFKSEVLFEFSELKTRLEKVKEDFGQSSQLLEKTIEEKITGNLEDLEDKLAQHNEKYSSAILSLQASLSEYFAQLQNTNLESDIKLDNSLKEANEIKREIKAILQSLEDLAEDSSVADLSSEMGQKIENLLSNISGLEEVFELKNQDALQSILSALEENFDTISAGLKEYKNFTKVEISEFIQDLEERLETAKGQINLTGTDILNTFNSKTNEIISGLLPISESINKITEINFEELVIDLKDKIDNSSLSITNALKEKIKDASTSQLEKVSQEFSSLSEKLEGILSKLSEDKTDEFEELKIALSEITQNIELFSSRIGFQVEETEFLNENFTNIENSITSLKSQNANLINKSLEKVMERLSEFDLSSSLLKEVTVTSKEELLAKINVLQDTFLQSQDDSKMDLTECIESNCEEIIGKMEDNRDKILQNQDDARNLLNEVIQAQDETKTMVLEELESNISFIKESLASFAETNSLSEEVSEKITSLQDTFNATVEEINEKLSASEEKYKTSTQSLISKLKTGFSEKVEDSMDDLKSFIEVLEDKKVFLDAVDALKTEIFDKFAEYSEDFEKTLSFMDAKEDIKALAQEVDNSIDKLFTNFEEKLTNAVEKSQSINELTGKTEEVARRIEDLKKNVTEDILEKIDEFELNLDTQRKDFSIMAEELKLSLSELKESYIDLSLNSTMEMSSQLVTIQEKLNDIEKTIGNIDFSDIIKSVESTLNDFDFDKIFEETKKEISDEFVAINQKLDVLALASNEDLEESLSEIKQIVQSQNDFIKKLDKLPDSNEVAAIKNEIQKSLNTFEEKLTSLSQIKPAETSSAGSLKEDLNAFKEELFESILDIFNQISFISEAEEIKDFVEEKTNEIKEDFKTTLKSSLGDNFNDIISSLDMLHEKANAVDNIKKEIKEVKHHLLSTKGIIEEDAEYSYSLQDIESDIAKVRMILKDLSEAKTGGFSEKTGDLDKLNEDIISLSTRTNKLLLNSDESNATLKENLSDFKQIIYQLEERVKYIDNTDKLNKVEKKLDDVNNLMLSSVKSDKIFNQTFMYLAEWVDSASENLENIIEKVSGVDEIKLTLNELKKTMPKSANIETVLDEISEKFDQQQEKIASLEEKIEALSKKEKSGPLDIKGIVAEVLSQMATPESSIDLKLSKKVDNIEKQLTKLGKGVEKLASYVDEE